MISDTHLQRSRRHRLWLTAAARRIRIIYYKTQETANINPFTAPACKISGLKDARTRLIANSIVSGSINTSTFNAMRFDEDLFTCQCEKRKQRGLSVSKFALIIGRFNDTVAVKGLTDRQRLESSGGSFGFQAERQFCPPQTVMIDS